MVISHNTSFIQLQLFTPIKKSSNFINSKLQSYIISQSFITKNKKHMAHPSFPCSPHPYRLHRNEGEIESGRRKAKQAKHSQLLLLLIFVQYVSHFLLLSFFYSSLALFFLCRSIWFVSKSEQIFVFYFLFCLGLWIVS